MDIDIVSQAKTKDEARDFAIAWQSWQSTQSLSWEDMFEWSNVFEELAENFDLTEEFKENGII